MNASLSPHDTVHTESAPENAATYSATDRAALEAHYSTHFGLDYFHVTHEKTSTFVHVDIYTYGASPDRPYVTLATAGMGAADVPRDDAHPAPPTELLTYVPADWDFEGPYSTWLFKALIETAKYPHLTRDAISKHHTLCTFDERTNLADSIFPESLLTHWYFRSLIHEPPEIEHLVLPSGRHMNFLWSYPITRAEYHYRAHSDVPLDLEVELAMYAPTEIDPHRPCVIQPENRTERRARVRQQKKVIRSLPRMPWMTLPCMYPPHQDIGPTSG
jgi:suppressor of fused protein SUFU